MSETSVQTAGPQAPPTAAGGEGAVSSGHAAASQAGQFGQAGHGGLTVQGAVADRSATQARGVEEPTTRSASQVASPAAAGEGPATTGVPAAEVPDTADGHTPGDYSFALPEGVTADPQLSGRFRDFCAGAGLTPQQAQAAVGFWLDESRAGQEQALTRCETALRERWGTAYENRLDAARGSLRVLDERMEGRLATLAQSGLGNAPEFVELMAHLAETLGEDSLGAVRGGGGGHETPLSTEEFLKTVVFKR